MAILEKEVLVPYHANTKKYYEELGYEFPKYIDKQKRIKVKKGTKIIVKIGDLSKGSNIKVTKICDECGKHIPNQPYNIILKVRENNKDLCYNCGKVKGGITKKEKIEYEQSLECFAKENNKEYLLREFSDKNKKKCNEIFPSTGDEYLWDCSLCGGEYTSSLNNRQKGSNCPYCSNRKVLVGFNDLWTTHPEIAQLLKDKEKGYEITHGVANKEIFICSHCGFEQIKSVSKIVERGFICSRCSDGISYPEKFIINVLVQLNLNFEPQKVFNWSENKRYDFFITELNCIIETHGGQHYKNKNFTSMGGRTLKEEIENDEYKKTLANKNGVSNYIVLDCRESSLKYIKNSIINSELIQLYDLSEINWNKCHEYACKSLVKTVCDLWNEGIDNTIEIGSIVKLGRSTVIRYLKQGTLLNWCNYDPKKAMMKNASLNGKRSNKKVVQLSKDGEYIKTWNSIREAQSNLGIYNISIVCKGRHKSAGGFKWLYWEDYQRKLMTCKM